MFNLRSRNPKFVPGVRTRAQKARNESVEIDDEDDAAAVRAARQPRIEEVPDEEAIQPITDTETPASSTTKLIAPPIPEVPLEHPYQKAKDAVYAPPTTRNVGAPIKAPVPAKKNEPAYKTLPPVHDPAIAAEVYKRTMDATITITQ